MESFELPSGSKFDVTPLSYEGAWAVTQALLKEVEKTEINLKSMDLKKFLETDIMSLKGPICNLLSSNNILEAVKKCFKKCRYNDLPIDAMTFEDKKTRGDFLYCAFYALKENAAPFFETLVSRL